MRVKKGSHWVPQHSLITLSTWGIFLDGNCSRQHSMSYTRCHCIMHDEYHIFIIAFPGKIYAYNVAAKSTT